MGIRQNSMKRMILNEDTFKSGASTPAAPAAPKKEGGGGLLGAIGLGKNSFTAKKTYNPYETNKAKLSQFENYIGKQKTFDPNKGNVQAAREMGMQTREQQQGLGQRFEDVLAGRGPSVAEQQMRMGQEEALKGAAALGATQSARGAGYGGIARGIMQQGAQASQDVAQKAGLLRAQEQQAAMGQYGQLLGQTRGQDLQSQQQALSEEQVAIQTEQYKNDMKQKLLAMGMNIEQAEAQAQAAAEQQRLEAQKAKRGFFGKLLGGVARIGAGIVTGGASEVALAGLKGIKNISGGGGGSAGPAAAPMPAASPYIGSGPTMIA